MNWLEEKMGNLVLARMGAKMGSGWKGKAGAVGVGLGAIAAAITELAGGTITIEKAVGYWTAIMGALSLFGIRDALPAQKSPLK
jgi:hypothetical protein